MKSSGKNIFKRLTFQIVSLVLCISIVLAIGFYVFLLRPITHDMANQIDENMQEHARNIYSICDQSNMEIMRLGVPDDDPAITVTRGYTLGLIESYMLREGIHVIVSKDDIIILKPDMLPKDSIATILQTSREHNNKPLSVITHEGMQFYMNSSFFDPWNCR